MLDKICCNIYLQMSTKKVGSIKYVKKTLAKISEIVDKKH
jgi:hypothetical protein